MGDTGLELGEISAEKIAGTADGGAHCGAMLNQSPFSILDPDLAQVVAAWRDLPLAIRVGILAAVNACLRSHEMKQTQK
ncbi:MAG TPA: hypothetical protein VK176_12015 [Phycisphaerales bacterium]|nr:hypothetical protein [Phycisphaerales bacterium]